MSSIQSQTFNILKVLKKKEWKELKLYFASPFFFNPKSKESVLPKFVDALHEYYEGQISQNPANPTYEYIEGKLYHGEKTTKRRITNLLSKLEEHLNTFFKHSYLKQDKIGLNDVWILKQLNSRLDETEPSRAYSKRKLKKIEGNFEQFSEQSSSYWYSLYLLKIEKGHFFKWADNFERDTYIKSGMKNLDFFYLLEKLKYMCVLCDRSKVTDRKIDDLRLEEFLKYLESIKSIIWEESPIFRMYYYLLTGLIHTDKAATYYENLQNELIEFGLEITYRERQNLSTTIVNYYIRGTNGENPYYKEKLYRFYRQMLDRKLILIGEKLSYSNYRNLSIMAIKQGDWSWAKGFVEEYRQKITPHARAKDIHAYCLALLSFNQETPDYEKTIGHLMDVKSNFVFFMLWRRTLLIRCYYEMGENYANSLEAELNSFKQYIRTKKMKERPMAYRNFVRFLRRIVQVTVFDKNKAKYKTLHKEIKETYPLIHREWLLDKLEAKTS